MKTQELIELLSAQAGPADTGFVQRCASRVAAIGLLSAGVIALALLGPIPANMLFTPAPWLKLAYAGVLAFATGCLFVQLGKPGAPSKSASTAAACVVSASLLFGCLHYFQADLDQQQALLWGHSWIACPWLIALVSLPGLVGSLWAMRSLAPTRPAAAGFGCGVFAGSLGAMGYALACTESSPIFVALWYTLGIVLVGVLGALAGPRVLRW
ncbi:MAG TPA: DUF1109 domain-containing protein [Limnobacter sp.]|nr:DUF1109 domain-containing protein [Limnobacter sp.]